MFFTNRVDARTEWGRLVLTRLLGSSNSSNRYCCNRRTEDNFILLNIFFGPYIYGCITIWTGDVDKVNLILEFLNSLDENLNFIVEIGGKSLFFLDLKSTVDDKKM